MKIHAIAAQILTFYTAYAMAGGCPDPARGEVRMFRDHCYEFVTDSAVYYKEAVEACGRKGAHLVHVKDKETQAWITGVFDELEINTGVWLGLQRKRGENNEWHWDAVDPSVQGDNTALAWSQWYTKEPDPASNRACARFGNPGSTNFEWVASVCDFYPYHYPYVCQYDGNRGFFGRYENIIAVCVASLAAVLSLVVAVMFIRNCYKKRKALMRRLHHNSGVNELKKSNIDDESLVSADYRNITEMAEQDCDIFPSGTPPPHYAPVFTDEEDTTDDRDDYNLNIIRGNCRSPVKPVHTKSIDITPTRSYSMVERTTPTHQNETTPVLRSQSLVEPKRPNDLMEEDEGNELVAVSSPSSQSEEAIEECSSLLENGAEQSELPNQSNDIHIYLEEDATEATPLQPDNTPHTYNDLS